MWILLIRQAFLQYRANLTKDVSFYSTVLARAAGTPRRRRPRRPRPRGSSARSRRTSCRLVLPFLVLKQSYNITVESLFDQLFWDCRTLLQFSGYLVEVQYVGKVIENFVKTCSLFMNYVTTESNNDSVAIMNWEPGIHSMMIARDMFFVCFFRGFIMKLFAITKIRLLVAWVWHD